ncbi:MAG: hypothetical protein ACI9YE_002479 [Psychroserpens sp.]|jgi:hypothetical protein
MLDVMKFTAQAVSEIAINPSVKKELLSYGLQEFDGEVTAHFSKLLNDGNPEAVSSDNSKGTFSRLFENKAQQFESNQLNIKSQSAGSTITDLEAFLKDKNMALYGPYLAENHANSDKPLTVSFDPLDGSKTSSIGYILVPKTSSGSTANSGGLDAPNAISNYELIEISGIDDDYAYNNPTLFVIIDDAGSSGGGGSVANTGSGSSSGNTSTRAIDCETLKSTDIVELIMPKFRLNGNLAWQPWEQNILDMWVVTKDDISGLDINGKGILNNSSSKLWAGKQVSRRNGRDKNWLNPDIPFLESDWKKDETEMVILISYKERSSEDSVDFEFKSVNDETTQTTKSSFFITKAFTLMAYANFDRCSTLANFLTDRGSGLHEGRRIYSYGGKLDFVLQPYVD